MQVLIFGLGGAFLKRIRGRGDITGRLGAQCVRVLGLVSRSENETPTELAKQSGNCYFEQVADRKIPNGRPLLAKTLEGLSYCLGRPFLG